MYQCFHCLANSVCWDCDYSFEDFGYEGEGIVQICHCANCGAEIEYRIPIENEDINELEEIYERLDWEQQDDICATRCK